MNTAEQTKTERKQQIVNFVSAYVQEHGLSPTHKQISDKLQILEGALRHLISHAVCGHPNMLSRSRLIGTGSSARRRNPTGGSLSRMRSTLPKTSPTNWAFPSDSIKRVMPYEEVLLAMSELLAEMAEGKVK